MGRLTGLLNTRRPIALPRGLQIFSVKRQVISNLGLGGYMVFVATSQLYFGNAKEATDNS